MKELLSIIDSKLFSRILRLLLFGLIFSLFTFLVSNIVVAEHNWCESFPEGSLQCVGLCIGPKVTVQGGFSNNGEDGCVGCNQVCSTGCGAECDSNNDCVSNSCYLTECTCQCSVEEGLCNSDSDCCSGGCSNGHCCPSEKIWEGTECITPFECFPFSSWINCDNTGATGCASACGNCGTQQRWCDASGNWGGTQCVGQGCSPGATETQGCVGGGTQTRTCTGSCTWTDWSSCPPASCGNGVINSGEQCDNGPNNGACPRTCSNSCTINSCLECGDGNIDSGEQCDNGPNNGACPRTCSNSCTNNNCGVPTRHLSVSVTGPGRVTSSGVSCPPTCEVDLPLDYALTLTPEPDTGAKHDSWGGDCSGVPANSPCSGTMSVDRSVSASFSLGGCGNGVLNPGEQCDNGPNNGACPRTCSNSCTINSCPVCTPGDVTCSGSLRLQCDSSGNWQTVEDCNNRDGGYCIGNVRETRDYGCSLGSCTYTLSSTEDCSTKTSVDSDGSPTAYDVAGTVTDYTTCASSACNSNPFSDYCLLKSVFEYGASGNSVSGPLSKNCEEYEGVFCDVNNRYIRREWGCSGTPGFCNDATVPDTSIGLNDDGDAKDKECGDLLCDKSANVYDATKTANEVGLCTDGLNNDCDALLDCADSDCSINPPCCTTESRKCKSYTQDEFDTLKQILKSRHGITLTPSINKNTIACQSSTTDTRCCPASTCVYNGNCYNHKQLVDIDGDGYPERCVAQSPGEWIEDIEIYCSNGLDDDSDGFTDCDDSDCGGTISGTIRNENNQPISLADVNVKKDITTVQSAITDISGTYSISIGCGTYNLIAAHPDYAPLTKSDISLGGGQQLTVDFNMVLGTSCEDDCTFAADNIVHASCDGRSGCNFYDNIAKQVCDLSQPGWVRDYDANKYIVCAEGTPQTKANIQASVTCSSGTLVKMTRIVVYKGKPVKLVVATCG